MCLRCPQAVALGFDYGFTGCMADLSFMGGFSIPLEDCQLTKLEELQRFKMTAALYLKSINLSSKKLEVIILRCLPRLQKLELQGAGGVAPGLKVLELVDVGLAEDELCKLLEAHADSLVKLQLGWHKVEETNSSSSSSGEDTEEGGSDEDEEEKWRYPYLEEYAGEDFGLSTDIISSIASCRHLRQLWLIDQRERSRLTLYDFLGLAHGCPELQLLRLDIPSLASCPTMSELRAANMNDFSVVNERAQQCKVRGPRGARQGGGVIPG